MTTDIILTLTGKNNKRVFDFKNYINPKMDESFNFAFWKPNLWEKIQSNIRSVYCPLKTNPLYKERVNIYQKILRINSNDSYIKEFFSNRPKFERSSENIPALCE